jgi:uncharacterized membrane protein
VWVVPWLIELNWNERAPKRNRLSEAVHPLRRTPERSQLEERITQVQRNEHCLRRAVGLMGLLTVVAAAGLCYCALFCTHFPQNMLQFMMHFLIKVFCALGLASLICLPVFVGFWGVYRQELNRRREDAVG